jgi:hypothetical protein
LLLETDAAAEGGDVVIARKESDQAKDHSATGLDGTEVIQAGPGAAAAPAIGRGPGSAGTETVTIASAKLSPRGT